MASNLKLLAADKVTDFVSHDFSNILAGSIGVQKLVFVSSYGDVDAELCEFGVYAVSGNDGYTFTQISAGEEFSANTTTLSAIVNATGGSITDSTDIRYRISVIDGDDWESAANSNIVVPTLEAGNLNQVVLSWTAVTGAATYGIYVSLDGGTTYKQLATTALLTYTDNTGSATLIDPQSSGARAYRPTTWTTAPLSLGTLAVGATAPVYVRENIPGAATSVGNQRHHKTYLGFN